jgi:hypothetical protein
MAGAAVTEILIDLDRPDPGPRRAEGGPRWSGPTPGQLRALLVVAVLLVAAFGVGAGAAPRAARFAGPVRIPGSGADEFLLADDFVVVNSGRDQRMYGYGLDGSLRWAAGLPFPRANLAMITDDLVLLTSPMWPGQTAAIERATGSQRWAVDGLLNALTEDTVVVSRGSSNLGGFDDEMVAFDLETGRELWQSPKAATGEERALPVVGAEHRLAGRLRVDPDGTGELLDFRTGRTRTLSDVPEAPTGPAVENVPAGVLLLRHQGVLSLGDLVVVFPYPPDPSGPPRPGDLADAAAYGPDSPRPLWTVTTEGGTSVLPCGPWICLSHLDATRVLDPATGSVLRQIGWPSVISGSERRLLGYDYAGMAATTQVAVFDAGTGRVLGSHLGWLLVSARYADWVPMMRRAGGLSWQLATLSLETGVAYPLGTFDAAGERACQNTATHVACTVRSGEVMVWRHAPARSRA